MPITNRATACCLTVGRQAKDISGGLAQKASVSWATGCAATPISSPPQQAMAIGTAGYTAML